MLVDSSISCQPGCNMSVLSSDAVRVREALAAYDAKVCKSAPQSCGIRGQCAEIRGSKCVEGTCFQDISGLAN
jgi:hypothetical protein